MQKSTEKTDWSQLRKIVLVICNILLVSMAVVFAIVYSHLNRAEQIETKKDTFISAVESMKQISSNYIENEKGYAENWAAYINSHPMTMDEALDYIRSANTQSDRYAHIVDMDTFEARSTYIKDGSNYVDCYKYMKQDDIAVNQIFIANMENMFNGVSEETSVLGKYRVNESQITAVSVGTRVTLKTAAGDRDYLLLRVIPVEKMKNIWIFPMDYSTAEVSIITRSGSYVIQSASMRSESFLDYIRGYNFENDYNRVNDLENQLLTTDSGLMYYKNFRGEDCVWYYSSFGENSGLDILGYIKADDLMTTSYNWSIVAAICGALLLLMIMDGQYLMSMNRRLRETAEMAERASLAKTQFLASMSHDIRTPMNTVLGMTDIARRNISDPDYVTQCLNKVTTAGNHLLTLINDILDISKVESGRMVLNPSSFSLERSVTGIIDIIRPQLSEKRLELSGQYSGFPHNYVIADELRLNQILINLLTNAVKYTKPGGKIELTIREDEVPGSAEKTRLVFIVSDNGIGMSEDFQKVMYESFSRAKNSQLNKIQGSGLGLTIVRQMVDLMHGSISCESTPGEGTTFTVEIDVPIAETPPEIPGESESVGSDISGMHVLVAEDNDLNWEIISTMLDEYGVSSERTENGQECADRINASPDGEFDIILMDIQMPVMNGREATKLIRQNSREYVRSIPIVAMTADAFAEDVQACLDCGMDGHISKPVNIQHVLRWLNKVKDRRNKPEK